jgi:hypothetical protein
VVECPVCEDGAEEEAGCCFAIFVKGAGGRRGRRGTDGILLERLRRRLWTFFLLFFSGLIYLSMLVPDWPFFCHFLRAMAVRE